MGLCIQNHKAGEANPRTAPKLQQKSPVATGCRQFVRKLPVEIVLGAGVGMSLSG